jgi:hypothetical protein
MKASAHREAERQALLVAAVLRDPQGAALAPWLRERGARADRGLAVYRANAGALAERALAAAFPVLRQLIGEESFAGLARAFWQAHPPVRGDIAQWGAELAAFVAAAPTLADEPYLADVARLEWALHQAASAADDDAPVAGLERLAEAEALPRLVLAARAGTALVESPHPIGTIVGAHEAHESGEPADASDRFAAVREAFAQGRAEAVLVWRAGLAVRHAVVPAGWAGFTRGAIAGLRLVDLLKEAGDGFDFEAWLVDSLRRGWLAAVKDDPS